MRGFWIAGLVLLIVTKNAYSQPEKSFIDAPLSDVLEEVEKLINIKFSYADKVIKNKKVSLRISRNDSIAHLLTSIESQTQLRLEKINDQYIIVRPYRANDRLTVCGYVLSDQQTPALGATITSSNKEDGAVADPYGFFQLQNIGYNDTLSISYVGFRTKKIRAYNLLGADCGKIVLRENIAYLDEIVVNDYVIKGSAKKNQKIEFSIQNLNMLPGLVEPDVLKSIQLTPGVNSPFETANGIYVRGGAPDQNLVLWNGIKIYDQGHLFGMLSAFNPYMVEKVDFIKQGTSAYYGDRVSGIIDIQTNQEVLKETEGGAGFDMIYSDINFKAPIIKEKLAVQGAVRRSFTDLLATPTYDRLSDRVFQNTKITNEASINNPGSTNKFFFNDLNFDLIAQPNPGEKWMTSILITENDLDFSSANTTNQTSFRDLLRTVNIGYNLRWERQLHDQLLLSSNIYHSQHLLDYQFENKVNDTVEVSSKKNLISDFGASLNADWTFENGNALSSGYQFSTNRMRHAFETKAPSYELVLDAADKTINTHSFHSEYEYLQSEKTYLSAGLRFNYYTGVEKYFIEPRLYMKYQIGRSLALNTSVEYRSQVATQIQESIVSDLSLENQVWTLAGEDQFPVIDSYQFTIGSSFTQNKWLIDADTYLKKINGITTLTFGFLNPIDNEYRVGSSSITGLDLFIKRKFSRYHTWFSYSFIHSENEFTGLNNDQPFPGNWNIEHTIKWSHFYQWKSIHFTVGWIWHTGKAFTEITENPTSQGPLGIQFAGINSSNLPPYHRLDFSVIYNFHFRKNQKVNYRIGLSILNVYNRKNLLNQEFRTTPTLENELISTNIYSLSFTPNLVFRVFW